MEFYTAIKNLIVIIAIYSIVMFMFYDYLPIQPIPNPSNIECGNVVLAIVGAIGYLFTVMYVIIKNIIVIMSFSFIPYPYNLLLAIPINSVFILSIITIVKEIIGGVKGVIPLPI